MPKKNKDESLKSSQESAAQDVIQPGTTPGRGYSFDPPAPEPVPEPAPPPEPEPIRTDYSFDQAPVVAPATPIEAAPLSDEERLALKQIEDLACLPHAKTVAEAVGADEPTE